MGKVQKTLRFEADAWARIRAAGEPGESDAAVIYRLIEMGLDSGGGTAPPGAEEGTGALVAALEANLEDLRKQVAVKDGQIEAMQDIAKAAQALHGASEVSRLETPSQADSGGRLMRAWRSIRNRDGRGADGK